jgi:Methyltransferase domain
MKLARSMLRRMPVDSPMPVTAGRHVEPQLRAAMRRVQDEQPIDSGGGATLTKVLVLADLIVAHDLRTVVELGVYRGRLLLPLGRLLAGLGRGEAIGIDPYSAQAAIQTDAHSAQVDLTAWALEQDWEGLHAGVATAIDRWQLGGYTRLIRERSLDAAGRFAQQPIDLLHVDGNHDAAAVGADLEAYLPAMRPGAFVVLDDASWASVLPQIQRLTDEQRLIFRLFDLGFTLDQHGGNDFAVFQIVNGHSSPAAADPPAHGAAMPLRELRSRLRRFSSS